MLAIAWDTEILFSVKFSVLNHLHCKSPAFLIILIISSLLQYHIWPLSLSAPTTTCKGLTTAGQEFKDFRAVYLMVKRKTKADFKRKRSLSGTFNLDLLHQPSWQFQENWRSLVASLAYLPFLKHGWTRSCKTFSWRN